MRARLLWTALALAACGGDGPPAGEIARRAEPAGAVADTFARTAAQAAAAPDDPGGPSGPEVALPSLDRAPPRPGTPVDETAAIRLPVELERRIDTAVHAAVARREIPGAVVAIGRRDGLAFLRAYGARALDPAREPNDVDTIYDLASLTKPIATATAIAILAERGALSIDDPAARFVPGVDPRITLRHLLEHTSGLPAGDPLSLYEGVSREQSIARIARIAPQTVPGTQVLYSDLGFALLGEIVAAASGVPLDAFVADAILAPLGMRSSTFRPPPAWLPRIAPTERAERRGGVLVRGEVHDPRAWRLGGVSGHAGLFASARDVARFALMMLGSAPGREGELEGARVLSAAGVRALIDASPRALGWDRRTAEEARTRGMGAGSIGHLGWTGTAIRIDPRLDLFLVVLSNDVHPDGRGDVRPLVAELDRALAGAAGTLLAAPTRDVRAGIDVELAAGLPRVAPAGSTVRAVLITHDAARARDGRRTLDALAASPRLTLLRVLAPEHGMGADREGAIDDGTDARTGLPVRGLFGPTRRPDDAMLEGADTLIVDLVDVGARFYTYASTMHEALAAAAARPGLRVVILDRPDPLGGAIVEGPGLDPGLSSFVNHHPLPLRHGLTLGELARMIDREGALGLGERLVVVRAEGWARALDGAAIGARWVPPSPNLPDLGSVELYPAVALLEGADVSVGRGTDAPFRLIGAPWMDAERVLARLAQVEVPGVAFEAATFTPRAARHRGRACEGVRVTVVDRAAYRTAPTGLAIVRAVLEAHRDRIDVSRVLPLIGSARVLDAITTGDWDRALALAREDGAAFEARRAPFLIYE